MRSRTVIVVVTLLVLASVPLAVGYFVLRGMDLSAYRPEAIALAKTWTGRDLRIDGDLHVGLHHGLLIRAAGLSLSNASWGSRPQMLTASRVEARLALLPLLKGELQVKTVVLYGADVLLETNASGAHNWDFQGKWADSGNAITGLPAVGIESGRVTWRQPGSDALAFTDLQLDMVARGDSDRLRASANLDGLPLKIRGRLPRHFGLAAGTPQPVDLRIEYGDERITGQGTVQQASWGLGMQLKVDANAGGSEVLQRLTGWPLAGLPPLHASAEVSRSATGWRFANLTLDAGPQAFKGELRIPSGAGRPTLTGSLTSRHVDLTELRTGHLELWRALQEAVSADLQWLSTFDATVGLRIERLDDGDFSLENIQVDGQLSDGRLTLDPIKADIATGGHAEGRLHGAVDNGQPTWSLDGKLQGVSAGLLLGRELASNVSAPMDLQVNVNTSGRTESEALAGLSGDIRLVAGAGRANLKDVDDIVGGLRTLTGQLLAKESTDAQLNCAVADFNIQGGVAKAKVLLIDSAVSTVRGDGQIDLGRRRIDLTFTPKAKRPTVNVAVPVHVKGSFEAPEFVADRSSMVGKLLGVAGLFVYPPAAVVTLGELGNRSNPCVKLMKGEAGN